MIGSETVFLIILAACIGASGGYGAILFRWLIRAVNRLAYPAGIEIANLSSLPWYVLLLVPAIGGMVVGPLIHFFAREARGHGVPEVMDAVANQGGKIRPRVAVAKILASAISIGVGAAVGREGPIVQIGSSIASSLGQFLHIDSRNLRLLVGCGAAAGIAATFNAPIAGAIFALEVILGVGTIRMFTPLVVSSVVATAISRHHLGDFPAFEVPSYALLSGWELPLYVLLGVVSAFVGVGFSRGLYWVEDLWNRLPLHDAAKPVAGGVAIGAVALLFPQVMGVGYETIGDILGGDVQTGLMLLLGILLAKMLTTHISLGAGFSGGIFAPSLFLGAALGGAFGLAASMVLPAGMMAPSGAYALVAMGAVVAAATHAPLTAILIVFEMTGDYRIMLPLMLACFIASTLSVRLSRESIYTLKLARRGSGVGHENLEDMMIAASVEAHMRPVANTLHPGSSFALIVRRALEHADPVMYVTSEQGLLHGEIHHRDVIALIRDETALQHVLVAADIMRPVATTVRPDDSLARTLRFLGHHPLAELPVVDDATHLVGTISRREILALHDREVLRREAALLSFVEKTTGDRASPDIVEVPAGEVVERIPVTARLAGQSLSSLDLRARHNVHVLGIGVDGDRLHVPDSCETLVEGDELVVSGSPHRIRELRRWAAFDA
ncbi:chloride channel protein [Myxococcota bacterium]